MSIRTIIFGATMALSAVAAGAVLAASAPSADGSRVTGTSGWAVVTIGGALARGSNATNAIHLSTGEFEVDFTTNISRCAYSATVGESSSNHSPPAAFVGATGRNGNYKGVYVDTFDDTGTPADEPFHLVVTC